MTPLETVREFTRLAWNAGDLDAARRLLADDVVDHDPLPFKGRRQGADALLQVVAAIRQGVPDLRRDTDVELVDDALVAVSFTDRGTHTGELLGIPATGAAIAVRGINVYRVDDGRITELRHVEDMLGLMRQLGVVPG